MPLLGGRYNSGILYGEDDDKIRPYNTGISPHEGSVATIILYSEGSVAETSGDSRGQELLDYDYLSDFQDNIESLESEVIGQTDSELAETAHGKIPTFSLDGREDDNYYGIFNNFSLLSVKERHDEVIKLHQNFSDGWNAFFFGEKPVIYSFSGMFIDSMDYPYYQEFMIAYSRFLSGRKIVDNNMQMKIMYDGKIISGYMINLAVDSTAKFESTKDFRFTILVNDIKWTRLNYVSQMVGDLGRRQLSEAWNSMDNRHRLSGTFDEPITLDRSGTMSPDYSKRSVMSRRNVERLPSSDRNTGA